MNEKRFRIAICMLLAFVLVTRYRQVMNAVSQVSHIRLASMPVEVIPTPTTADMPHFDPTAAPQQPQKQKPTNTPIPTSILPPSITPRQSPRATIKPSIKPTRIPTRVPTKTPIVQAPQVPVTISKLSVFMIGRYTAGAKSILESNPRIIKVIEPNSDPAFYEAIRKWRSRVPGGIAMVRFYTGTQGLYYPVESDPKASAEDFFAKVIKPGIDALGSNRNLFDYHQSPNEFENTPQWRGEANMKWNGIFWERLTQLSAGAGIKPCIAGIPVGNIEPEELGYVLENLKRMHAQGAAFCYHSYTFNYSRDVNHEIWYSLRYRKFYDFFQAQAPELASMPLILSEGGIAENGDPYAGYLKSGKIDEYKGWLTWFDGQIRQDSYVKGITLFQIGNDSDWGYFNLEPVAPWLGDYLQSQR